MNLRQKNFFAAAVAAVAVAAALPIRAQDDTVTWRLVPDAKVDSSGIFLSQLVVPTTSSLVVSNSPVVLPHLRLAPAPSLGQTALISRDQVIQLARQSVPELAGTNWTGPRAVRVARRMHPITESEMIQLLTDTLQKSQVKDLGELELHLSHQLPPQSFIPDEGVTAKITELPGQGLQPEFFVRFELWNETEHVSDWQLAVKASIWRDVPIASERLIRGELLKDAPVQLERRDILITRDAILNWPPTDPNMELVDTVPAGMPVLNRSIHVRPLVARGRMVDGIYEDGALSISLKVEALEDGLAGQTIRVMNPKTKRELFGKVKNEQTILITL